MAQWVTLSSLNFPSRIQFSSHFIFETAHVLRDDCTASLDCNSGWVGSVRMDFGFSLCAAPTSYRSPSISYVIWNSGPQVLGSGSAGIEARRQGKGVRDRGRGNLE